MSSRSRTTGRRAFAVMVGSFLALATAGASAEAATWDKGDLFLGIASGSYQVRAPDGTLKETLTSSVSPGGFTTGCALDQAGDFYGTYFSNSRVVKFDDVHPHADSLFGAGHRIPESIVFDAAGNVYVGNVGGGIDQFLPDGTFVKTIVPGVRVDFFDIAADQDTILFTQEGSSIRRASIATGTALSDFTTGTATNAFSIRILPDGGALLADRENVKRYDAAGTVIQTYDAAGEGSWFSLNLDPDGTTFWAGNFSSANYYRLNIATAAVAAGPFNTGTPGTLFGICLKGEPTAAETAIVLTPETATNEVGTSHTVTATLSDGRAGVVVTFRVTAGPNAGVSGTGVTNASGEATFTYTGAGGPGTDTIEAEFTSSSGKVIKSNPVTKIWTPKSDTTAPSCSLTKTGTDGTGKKYIEVTVRDTGSGLASVVATKSTNATTFVPPFTPGTTDSLVVRATKINQSQSSVIELTVHDVAGNVTVCDPVMTVVIRDEGRPVEQTFTDIPRKEHWVRIYNGDPGVQALKITVNGKVFKEVQIKPNEERVVDIGAAMGDGNNTVTLSARGKSNGEALVLISD